MDRERHSFGLLCELERLRFADDEQALVRANLTDHASGLISLTRTFPAAKAAVFADAAFTPDAVVYASRFVEQTWGKDNIGISLPADDPLDKG